MQCLHLVAAQIQMKSSQVHSMLHILKYTNYYLMLQTIHAGRSESCIKDTINSTAFYALCYYFYLYLFVFVRKLKRFSK